MSCKNKSTEEVDKDISFIEALRLSKHIQFEKKEYQLSKLNKPFKTIRDEEGYIINIVEGEVEDLSTEKSNEVIANEVWFGVEISDKVKLPLPTHCLKDKKYCAKEYSALMVLSNKSIGEYHRYTYKNKFNTTELANELDISRVTLERNIKKLDSLDYNILKIEKSKEGVIYKLFYGEVQDNGVINKFVTINQPMLKKLVCDFSSNAIKIYCVLRFIANEKDFTTVTEAWLCEQVGLSSNSEKNQTVIRGIISELEECHFIETKKISTSTWSKDRKKKIPITYKQYRLCSYYEWKELNNTQ